MPAGKEASGCRLPFGLGEANIKTVAVINDKIFDSEETERGHTSSNAARSRSRQAVWLCRQTTSTRMRRRRCGRPTAHGQGHGQGSRRSSWRGSRSLRRWTRTYRRWARRRQTRGRGISGMRERGRCRARSGLRSSKSRDGHSLRLDRRVGSRRLATVAKSCLRRLQ